MDTTLSAMADSLLADPLDEATLSALADLLTDCEPGDRVELLRRLFRRAAGLRRSGVSGETVVTRRYQIDADENRRSSVNLTEMYDQRSRHEVGRELIDVLLEIPAASVVAKQSRRFSSDLGRAILLLETRVHVAPVVQRGPFALTANPFTASSPSF